MGDGVLSDKGSTKSLFRDFLRIQNTETIGYYARQITHSSSNGKILQDLTNILGERMGFSVEHGRYVGTKNVIGFDGFWQDGLNHLIIEVKTTDSYRINTQTLLKYSERLKGERNLSSDPLVLIVVGRIDIGDLEAQIRGSRADDCISVISIDSLVNLAEAMDQLSGGPASRSMRELLFPKDHTRLDSLVGLITDTISEIQSEVAGQNGAEELASGSSLSSIRNVKDFRQITARLIKRKLGELNNIAGSPARFKGSGGSEYFLLFSKRYHRQDQQYWYSINKNWIGILSSSRGGLVLGMEAKGDFYLIPAPEALRILSYCNEANQKGKNSVHLAITETDGNMRIILPKKGTTELLLPFKF